MVKAFNPPPGWPAFPPGWVPPPGWQPDPSWPAPPAGWTWWVEAPQAPAPGAVFLPSEAPSDLAHAAPRAGTLGGPPPPPPGFGSPYPGQPAFSPGGLGGAYPAPGAPAFSPGGLAGAYPAPGAPAFSPGGLAGAYPPPGQPAFGSAGAAAETSASAAVADYYAITRADRDRRAGRRTMTIGLLWFGGAAIVTLVGYALTPAGGHYVVFWGAMVGGLVQTVRGLVEYSRS